MRRRVLIGGLAGAAGLAGTVGVTRWADAATTAAAPKAPTRAAIIATMKKVDDFWVNNGTDLKANNWKNATFHVGNLAAVTAAGVTNHVTRPWCQANKFALPTDKRGPFFPDTIAPGEVYLDLLAFHPDAGDTCPNGHTPLSRGGMACGQCQDCRCVQCGAWMGKPHGAFCAACRAAGGTA